MELIDSGNALRYLRERGVLAADEAAEVSHLAGGVSNLVLYVKRASGQDLVLKQARPQLRVAEPWFCSVQRVWREVEVLRVCQRVLGTCDGLQRLPKVQTPGVLLEDRENYVFAMTAAPRHHQVWKDRLLSGKTDPRIARACGWLLASLHGTTWDDAQLAGQLADRTFFEQLRLDPYYRHVARAHQELQPWMERLIQVNHDNLRSLVHGDFSPKNLLVTEGTLTLVDFEVGHFGDPAFDLGFFLSHLVLKTFRAGRDCRRYFALSEVFWESYLATLARFVVRHEVAPLVERTVLNFAGCVLARVDGKSKVDYLADPDAVRRFAMDLLGKAPPDWQGVKALLRRYLDV